MSFEYDKILLETQAEIAAISIESAAIMVRQTNDLAGEQLFERARDIRIIAAEAIEKMGRVRL